MVNEFLSWWTQQILDLVPKRLSALGDDRGNSRRGRLYLRISLIPKAGLWPLMAALEEAGAAPHWLETPMPGGQARLIAVARSRSRSDVWRRRSLAAAGGLCGILGVAVV